MIKSVDTTGRKTILGGLTTKGRHGLVLELVDSLDLKVCLPYKVFPILLVFSSASRVLSHLCHRKVSLWRTYEEEKVSGMFKLGS